LSHDDAVLLFFGMIKPNKGLLQLIQAMPAVLAVESRAKLLIAGEPLEDFGRYAREIERLGISERVDVRLGYVKDEDVGAYFQAADVVVLPHTDISLSGVASVALGYGRPIVGTRRGGLADLVEDGVSGFLVEAGSVRSLGEGLQAALADRERLARMGQEAGERFRRENNMSKSAERSLALYRNLLGR
jgi:glycosyltransferase involved in cell wall biosynthesis